MADRKRSRENWGSKYLDGAELKRRRDAAGMSQTALADAIGGKVNHLSHWEAGHYGCEIDVIARLAAALGCKPAELMHAEGRRRYKALVKQIEALKAA